MRISDWSSAVCSSDLAAGYLLGRWDSDTLRVIGGVRYEHTKNDIRANTVTVVTEGGELPDGTEAEDDTLLPTVANQFKRSYGDWLPRLTLRWEPQQNLVLRAAGSSGRAHVRILVPNAHRACRL